MSTEKPIPPPPNRPAPPPPTSQVLGKRRGTVTEVKDPDQAGRLRVQCPGVLPDEGAWAMPCVGVAGKGRTSWAGVEVGDQAWIEFEGGDPAKPIVAGFFWQKGQGPEVPYEPGDVVFAADGVRLALSGRGDERKLDLALGRALKLALGRDKVELTAGKSSFSLTEQGGLTATLPPLTLRLGPGGLSLDLQPVALKVTANELSLVNGSSGLALKVAEVLLDVAKAGKIAIQGPKVTINDGALEVL